MSIDTKIVEMKFKNSQFEAGAKETLSTIDKLKKALSFEKKEKGLNNIDKAAKSINFNGAISGADALGVKLSKLQIIGYTALQNLTNSAVNFGKKLSTGVFQPLFSGGWNRATNIERAHFQLEGLLGKMDKTWNGFKTDILYGVKDTAYGFDEAARVASQLAASGYRAGDSMKTYLRSISGVSAMTNSSYTDIGNIFTTVAGNGRLMGEQLLQLSSRGLNASAALVKYFKEVRGESSVTESSIRDMVSKGKIDFDTFAKAMDYSFGEHAKEANKTFDGALANMRASLARIGADVAGPLRENLRDIFNALTPIFDRIHVLILPIINSINKYMGGAAKGIINILHNIFHETDKGAKTFGILSDAFLKNSVVIQNIITVFNGLLSIIHLVIKAVLYVANVFSPVLNIAMAFGKVLLSVAASVSNFFIKIDKATGGVSKLTTAIGSLKNTSEKANGSLSPMGYILDGLSSIAHSLHDVITNLAQAISKVFKSIGVALSNIGGSVSKAISGKGLEQLVSIFNSLTAVSIVYGLKSMAYNIKTMLAYFKDGIVPGFKSTKMVLDQLHSTLFAFQQDLQADMLKRIASAVLRLAIALLVLSTIKADKMAVGLTGLASATGILVVAMSYLMKIAKSSGIRDVLKLNMVTGQLVELSTSILVLSLALKQLSSIKPKELATSLGALTYIFALIYGFTSKISKAHKSFYSLGGGMIVLAVAIKMLVKPITELSKLKISELVKGLGSLSALLLMISKFSSGTKGMFKIKDAIALTILAKGVSILTESIKTLSSINISGLGKGIGSLAVLMTSLSLFSKYTSGSLSLITTAASIYIISKALNGFVNAISVLGALNISTLAKGIGSIVATISLLGFALNNMSGLSIGKSIGIYILANALDLLSKSILTIGGANIKSIITGIGSLAIIIGGLVVAMNAMNGSIAGAAGMWLMSKAIENLVAPIQILGAMKVGSIVKSLLTLAVAIGVVAGAGVLLAAISGPMLIGSGVLLAFSAALALFGVALLKSSIGITAFMGSMKLLQTSINSGGKNIISTLSILGKGIGNFIVQAAKVIASKAEIIASSIFNVIKSIIIKIGESAPEFINCGIELLKAFLSGVKDNIQEIVSTSVLIVTNFVNGISENADKVVQTGFTLISNFIQSIGDNLYLLVDAGFKSIISFINGVTQSISVNAPLLVDAIINLALQIVYTFGYTIGSSIGRISEFGASFIRGFIAGLKRSMPNIAGTAGKIWPYIQDGIRGIPGKMFNTALDAVNGFIRGLGADGVISKIRSKAHQIANALPEWMRKVLGIQSPSRVLKEIGKYAVEGYIIGMQSMSRNINDVSKMIGDKTISTFSKMSEIIADSIDDTVDVSITPILDTSKIEYGANKINDILSTNTNTYTATMAGSINSRINGDTGETYNPNGVTNVEFIQNNYSPKSLSRLDIYRQTKNQINQIKDVVRI